LAVPEVSTSRNRSSYWVSATVVESIDHLQDALNGRVSTVRRGTGVRGAYRHWPF
jgi:hypothetical protein